MIPSGTAIPSLCNRFKISRSALNAVSGILPPGKCGDTCSRNSERFF